MLWSDNIVDALYRRFCFVHTSCISNFNISLPCKLVRDERSGVIDQRVRLNVRLLLQRLHY